MSTEWFEASLWSIPYSDLTSLIIPYFNDISTSYMDYWMRQSWLENYYVGITTIILAFFSLRSIRKDRIVKFLCIIAIGTVAVCLGRYFIAYSVLYKIIPIMKMIRYPVRFFFIATFSICALSGIGYDCLRGMIYSDSIKKVAKSLLATGFFVALLAACLTVFSKEIIYPIVNNVTEAFKDKPFDSKNFPALIYSIIFNFRRTLLYVSSFLLFIFLSSRTKKKGLAITGLFILVGFDLLLTNIPTEPADRIDRFKAPTENIRYIMKDRSLFRIFASPYAYELSNFIPERRMSVAMAAAKDRFISNLMMKFSLYDMWGYGSSAFIRNERIRDFIYESEKPTDTRLLNLLNVKYVVSHNSMRAYGYNKVNESPYASIYLNDEWLPRAILLRRQIVMRDEDAVFDYITSKKFDPKKEIIFEDNIEIDNVANSNIEIPEKDRVDILEYEPSRVNIDVSCKKEAFLLLSDTYYPGWKAYIDNKEAKIYRANYFLRAVKVPQGEHLVEFIYDPLSFRIGAFISIIALLSLIIYLLKTYFGCDPNMIM